MKKEIYFKTTYAIIAPICKFSDIQHRDGEWIDICKYHTPENDYPKCCLEECKYLKLIKKTIEG